MEIDDVYLKDATPELDENEKKSKLPNGFYV